MRIITCFGDWTRNGARDRDNYKKSTGNFVNVFHSVTHRPKYQESVNGNVVEICGLGPLLGSAWQLRLRSFPPTRYSVTHLGKTEFLVPFSCLLQTALSRCPDKTRRESF